jgi:hypothetical protein
MNLVSELDLPAFDYSGGVEGIYGIDKLPVSWSGSAARGPNRGPAPDVS